jgi:hypothetical protein
VHAAESKAKELRARAARELKEETAKAKQEGREISSIVKRKAEELEAEAEQTLKKTKRELEKVCSSVTMEASTDPTTAAGPKGPQGVSEGPRAVQLASQRRQHPSAGGGWVCRVHQLEPSVGQGEPSGLDSEATQWCG